MRTSPIPALLLAACLSGAGSLPAGTLYRSSSLELRLKGQLRNVLTVSRTTGLFGQPRTYLLDTQRLRTDWSALWANGLSLRLAYDNQVLAGDYLDTDEYRALRAYQPPVLVDLDREILDRRNLRWLHRLYRLHLDLDRYPVRLTVGRQQVSWGTGRIWNPTDIFNPVAFLLVEQDERFGADAASLEVSLGTLSGIQAVWAPASDPHRVRGALSLKTNWRDYDLSVMGGLFYRDRVAGASFSGQVGGAGLRGEYLHNFGFHRPGYDQLVLGLDYRFSPRLLALAEYLYNSGAFGADIQPAELLRAETGGVISLSRHLAGFYADYELHPLVHASGYLSLDLEQGSLFFGPRLAVSLTTNLDLSLGVQLSTGSGEFGLMQNLYFLNSSWHF